MMCNSGFCFYPTAFSSNKLTQSSLPPPLPQQQQQQLLLVLFLTPAIAGDI